MQTECSPLMGAACGSVAGAVAAALTTPLDVVKTRIMLSTGNEKRRVIETLKQVYRYTSYLILLSFGPIQALNIHSLISF